MDQREAFEEWQAARAQGGEWLIQMRGDYLATRGIWERPDHRGYTNDIAEAGRYTEEEAREAERMLPEKCKAVRIPAARAQGGEAVAWLHRDRPHSDVITDDVKKCWGNVVPPKMQQYSIPLYTHPASQTTPCDWCGHPAHQTTPCDWCGYEYPDDMLQNETGAGDAICDECATNPPKQESE